MDRGHVAFEICQDLGIPPSIRDEKWLEDEVNGYLKNSFASIEQWNIKRADWSTMFRVLIAQSKRTATQLTPYALSTRGYAAEAGGKSGGGVCLI